MKTFQTKRNGYAALMSILILGAIGTVIATSMLLVSVGSAQMSLSVRDSDQARYLSDTCAEMALIAIRSSSTASGTTNLTYPEGTCSYNIAVGATENRTIQSTGITNNNIRKLKIVIDKINPKINLVSWQEVAEF